MKLIGIPLSPFVRKVAVILAIKELEYDSEPLMPGDESPEFRALSPLGKIPVLVDGDLSLADSRAATLNILPKNPIIWLFSIYIKSESSSKAF